MSIIDFLGEYFKDLINFKTRVLLTIYYTI